MKVKIELWRTIGLLVSLCKSKRFKAQLRSSVSILMDFYFYIYVVVFVVAAAAADVV